MSRRSDRINMHAERNLRMIALSGHFKTLIFCEICDVLSSKFYCDHGRSLYNNTFPFDRVLSPIDGYFDRFELTQHVNRNTISSYQGIVPLGTCTISLI